MNIKYVLLAALIIAVIVALFTWDFSGAEDVSAETLSSEFENYPETAENKYQNKILDVSGNVKAFYKILGARPVLELETGESSVPVFFFFLSQENEYYAGQLQSGQRVVIRGRCVGENQYSFVNGVKIEVEEFIEK